MIALQAAIPLLVATPFIFLRSLQVVSGYFFLASLLQTTQYSVLPQFTLSFVCLLGGRGGTVCPARPMPLIFPPTGKSLGTGGGKLVGLRLLRQREVLCFGFIGAANAKVCLNESCTVESHSQQMYLFEDGADALVFIETGTGQSVWAIPAISPDAFGGSWSRYTEEKRSITSWQILLEALSQDPSMPESEVAKIGRTRPPRRMTLRYRCSFGTRNAAPG